MTTYKKKLLLGFVKVKVTAELREEIQYSVAVG